jgi:hypothetical protein
MAYRLMLSPQNEGNNLVDATDAEADHAPHLLVGGTGPFPHNEGRHLILANAGNNTVDSAGNAAQNQGSDANAAGGAR